MPAPLPDPFYYLGNFERVLCWIAERYADLLSEEEFAFLATFPTLPQSSRALLVRMAMRKGDLFRASKLRYDEIGCPRAAVLPLQALGWVDAAPLLSLEQLFGLLTRSELAGVLAPAAPGARKADWLAALLDDAPPPQPLGTWCVALDDVAYRITIAELCERLRLMFFGNLRQDWSEFVLADLGIYRYETVPLTPDSRGFQQRQDIDDALQLHCARDAMREGAMLADVLAQVPPARTGNAWLAGRRARLLFQIAQQYERQCEWDAALALYRDCGYPGARARAIRVLERSGDDAAACALAEAALAAPESDAERQQLLRMLPRLRRRAGLPSARIARPMATERLDLSLPRPAQPYPVEALVRNHLAQPDAPVFYVENGLLGSLFGLLCWPAIFAPVPGAFFHPFHHGPADLGSPDFHSRRRALFDACLAQLDTGQYRDTIRAQWRAKQGIQSPFVAWGLLDEALLELALHCLPPPHLKRCFERMLRDVTTHCAGLPDLIQFWPTQGCYRMIEVKGPGDRLQDNQLRWLAYFAEHGIPVAVCYVQWALDAPTPQSDDVTASV
ncbi:VRR-NUC domain-containing protein [Chitiniphilus eburneus]|uniref:phosphodiesterase I n=1 Tax=Chitiniphilus eburneus TaxID=2571148 RepID=A0A4U0QDF1_9NEIS|nr:VRR-NUC domain-containing protein [Chitiniphilus eburneus]TJZ73884.1 VRR-NUC domain-containing protein [Chitiniphilus eburneus]